MAPRWAVNFSEESWRDKKFPLVTEMGEREEVAAPVAARHGTRVLSDGYPMAQTGLCPQCWASPMGSAHPHLPGFVPLTQGAGWETAQQSWDPMRGNEPDPAPPAPAPGHPCQPHGALWHCSQGSVAPAGTQDRSLCPRGCVSISRADGHILGLAQCEQHKLVPLVPQAPAQDRASPEPVIPHRLHPSVRPSIPPPVPLPSA